MEPPRDLIRASRVLRQGDPLSLFLSHFKEFADDTMLLCYGNEDFLLSLTMWWGCLGQCMRLKFTRVSAKSWVLIVIGISLEGG